MVGWQRARSAVDTLVLQRDQQHHELHRSCLYRQYSTRRYSLTDLAETNTLSIDLSQSWTNSSVTVFATEKNAPLVLRPALWPDNNGQVFYTYNGAYADMDRTNASDFRNQVWQFTPDGNSGGVWTFATQSDSSDFDMLRKTVSGSYAYGDGVGYALGGIINSATNGPTMIDTMAV